MALCQLSVGVVAGGVVVFLLYDLWCHLYFWFRGMPGPTPAPLFGNILQLRKVFVKCIDKNIKTFGKVHGFYLFRTRTIIVAEPDLLREVMVKSFSKAMNRMQQVLPLERRDMSLIFLRGQKWRDTRHLLAPVFTSSKIKQMASLVNSCSDALVRNFKDMQNRNGCVELGDVFGTFTLHSIATCVFGTKVDSLLGQADHPLPAAMKDYIEINGTVTGCEGLIAGLFPILSRLMAALFRFRARRTVKLLTDLVLHQIQERKANRDSKATDILQLLIDVEELSAEGGNEVDQQRYDARRNVDDDDSSRDDIGNATRKRRSLSSEEIVSQLQTFMFAGFETTKSCLSFMFYELAMHPEIQDRLISEIDTKLPEPMPVDHEGVSNLEYLEHVIRETLRLYPPVSSVMRESNETFNLNGLTVEKGTRFMIPIYSIHRDPELWSHPDEFDPDRFSSGVKQHPFAWLPFGAGPRSCIAGRFAMMEVKIAAVKVLRKLYVKVGPETKAPSEPISRLLLFPKDGITVRVETRS